MGNSVSLEVVATIRKLQADGCGLREISRELGISKHTAKRYFLPDANASCGCGKPAGHNGWCKARYAKSAARQAYQAQRRGVEVNWTRPVAKSRQSALTQKKNRWLSIGEQDNFSPIPVPVDEHYGIIGDVRNITRRLPLEYKDDVTSSMIVACMDGRLGREEIKDALTTFLFNEMRSGLTSAFSGRSLDDPISADGPRTFGDVYGSAEWWQSVYA